MIIIEGKFQPYYRMTQRSKFADPRAQSYLASKGELQRQMRAGMTYEMWPKGTPLEVKITVLMPSHLHSQDLDNQVKALLDAAKGVLFYDDRYVDAVAATRELADRYRVLMTVGELLPF